MIRNAKSKDLKKLLALYAKVKVDRSKLGNPEYEANLQHSGFLLGTDDAHDISEEIVGAYQFLVFEEDGKILGYLIADHREEQKYYDDEYKTWFDPSLKKIYYSDPKGMTLATVATDPSYSGKGIATKLLKFLEEKLKKEDFNYLFSIVTLAPLTNCPSIVWHTKNGFKRLAMGRPRTLFEFDNYSAILLYKEL